MTTRHYTQKPLLLPDAKSLRIYEKPTSKSRPASANISAPIKRSSQINTKDLLNFVLENPPKRSLCYQRPDVNEKSSSVSANPTIEPERKPRSASMTNKLPVTNNSTAFDSTNNVMTDNVVIHVYDKARNGTNLRLMKVKRDFHCSSSILLREMKYFSVCIQDKIFKQGSIEIDVHCDVLVFELLMGYIITKHLPLGKIYYILILDAKNVTSVLISSFFLQMEALVINCLEFMKTHLNQIISCNFANLNLVPLDLRCIDHSLINRLSRLMEPSDVSQIIDPTDKIKTYF